LNILSVKGVVPLKKGNNLKDRHARFLKGELLAFMFLFQIVAKYLAKMPYILILSMEHKVKEKDITRFNTGTNPYFIVRSIFLI
jgi:hypothetical protein